jgi:hypothetical protein
MTTLKVEILRRYKELTESIRRETGKDLFPELGVVDATDIVCLICQFFGSCKGNYRNTIVNLAYIRGVFINSEDLEKVYPRVSEFIDFVLENARKK